MTFDEWWEQQLDCSDIKERYQRCWNAAYIEACKEMGAADSVTGENGQFVITEELKGQAG